MRRHRCLLRKGWQKWEVALVSIPGFAATLLFACGESEESDETENTSPAIERIEAYPVTLAPGEVSSLEVTATDADGDALSYRWTAPSGALDTVDLASVRWTAPSGAGTVDVTCTVSDPDGAQAALTISLMVVDTAGDQDGDGFSPEDGDCDDQDPDRYPEADEPADGRDNDCDGVVDEGSGIHDEDGDGYAGNEGDCDDTDEDVHPNALEIEDGIDNNCDGEIDEGTDAGDDDRDGYSESEGDCDDANPTTYPGATEQPDGVDNDCDEGLPGGGIDEETILSDDDGDGMTEVAGDCDDTESNVYAGAPELDNGIDDDCDGEVDEETEGQDLDGDGATVADGDCNDLEPTVYPGAEEQSDGVDNDCDGRVDEGTVVYDDDGDGMSEAAGDCNDSNPTVYVGHSELADGLDNDCDGEVDEGTENADDDRDGYTEVDGDCDDQDPRMRPDYPEVPDDQDNDCDGEVDEGTVLADQDGDGYSQWDGDCDDEDPNTFPGAIDLPDDGIDNGCHDMGTNQPPMASANVAAAGINCGSYLLDGTDSFDPEGDPITFQWTLIDGLETASLSDASSPSVWLTATADEVYRVGLAVSDGSLTGWEAILNVDTDALRTTLCEEDLDDDGFSARDGDCDDLDATIHPAAVEVCDGVDQNCDGLELLFEEDFNSPDTDLLLLDGSAELDTDSVLLTPAARDMTGSAFYAIPMDLENFVVRFEIQIDTGTSGNGMTIAFIDGEAPPFLGEGGAGNGLMGLDGWAIELDNAEDVDYGDPKSDHIALVRAEDLESAFTYPRAALRNAVFQGEIEVSDGTVAFTWNGARLFEEAPEWTLPARGFLGFTAATGTETDRHRVLSVSFECR